MMKMFPLLWICMLLAGGCSAQTLTTDSRTGDEEFWQSETTTEYNAAVGLAMEDMSEEFATILSQGSKEIFEGYSVDVAFLLWLQKEYGEEAIQRIVSLLQGEDANSMLWYEATGSTMHVLWLEYCEAFGYNLYELDNVHKMKAASPDVITMDFVGDICLDENWHTMQALAQAEYDLDACIAPEIQKELQSADITVVNNEFAYSNRGTPAEGKAYTFRANPSNVEYLKRLGTDLASLANNHVCDYGDEALQDTMDTLLEAGIPYTGAGANLDEASEIHYFVINGRKIAVVSATQIEKSYTFTKEATEDSPGVLKTLNPDKFLRVIKEAKENSDYVVAYVHWGAEAVLYLQKDQERLAEKFVEAGADIIVGHHSHRLQGMEYIGGVPVVNSLGNFWFCTGELYTTILQVQIDRENNLDVRYIPCLQKDVTTSLITEEAAMDEFYKYVSDISKGIGMDENGRVYDMASKRYTREFKDGLRYNSDIKHANRTGAYDLAGKKIDIVGNN